MLFETEFEWDESKAKINFSKHGVSFVEAATVFWDFLSVTVLDKRHSTSELRFITVGQSKVENILVVMHSERGDKIRIISARKANRDERRQYEEGK